MSERCTDALEDALAEVGRLKGELARVSTALEECDLERRGEKQRGNEMRDERDALRAELARLTPSGQVAEDVERLRGIFHAAPPWALDELSAALSRLAAKAQGYEEAVADNAALLQVLKDGRDSDEDDDAWADRAVAAIEAAHPGSALLKEKQEQRETIKAVAVRLKARVDPTVASCMCFLTAPERCNNCKDRAFVAKVLP